MADKQPYIGNSSPFFAGNETYLAELYARYCRDRESLEASMVDFFDSLEAKEHELMNDFAGPSWRERQTSVINTGKSSYRTLSDVLSEGISSDTTLDKLAMLLEQGGRGGVNEDKIHRARHDTIRAIDIIRAYRIRGHLEADLDPLNLIRRSPHPDLDPTSYGFEEKDMDRQIFINYHLGRESASMREIIKICRKVYCGTVGVEFMHIQSVEEKLWIRNELEGYATSKPFSEMGKRTILNRLMQAEEFESFLDTKYRGSKRFGLDGAETLVPMIEQIIKRSAQLNIEEINIGMSHRGRLNVLGNIMQKPYRAIFSEFNEGTSTLGLENISGDVKYHLGTSSDREFDGNLVHLSLAPNPSHLEAVNTVVLGKVRAKQAHRNDGEGNKVMGLLLHGDAAFIGQGNVAETFLLSELQGYATGGTIHIAINNQIGFTTNPSEGRSSPYCSDIAKVVDAPVFHVNGDDPESCIRVARLAIEYRQQFKKDAVIDLWCYRRHGHNEGDEPMFTQPRMYQQINSHPKVSEVYTKQLVKEKLTSYEEVQESRQKVAIFLQQEFEACQGYKPNKADWLEGQWSGLELALGKSHRCETDVPMDNLLEIGAALCRVPANFNLHPRLQKLLKQKHDNIKAGENIDWATAEALSFGSLLCEATSIRLSGEDCRRGTFSQRHSVLIDQKNEEKYIPLNNIRTGQAPFEVIDSPLSEFGLLGFEYGYATAEPHSLVIWEAQFGDFANGAQIIIDQFIASGESKWLRMCGLVLLLPHAYEGQGPEHSSARLERYLQLSAENNWQVCNITSPANYFHVLRRQIRRNFRKPLIIMSPKSLLRHKLCVSKLSEFSEDSMFHRVLWDDRNDTKEIAADKDIRLVVLCSGKIYFDLLEYYRANKIKNVTLLRLEQIYPFPSDGLEQELSRYKNAKIAWCQEEPENSGAWNFVDRRIEEVLQKIKHEHQRPIYVGRPAAASPATGNLNTHKQQQEAILKQTLTLK